VEAEQKAVESYHLSLLILYTLSPVTLFYKNLIRLGFSYFFTHWMSYLWDAKKCYAFMWCIGPIKISILSPT
jgi:hypothetical protein